MTALRAVTCWLVGIPGISQNRQGGQPAVTAAGYVLLFLLGALQGLIGSFQYGRSPAPLIAIVLVVILFATCVGCGWGVGTFAGGLVPALGWFVTAFIIAMPRPNGSVVITATAAGEWFLYGGAAACLVGTVIAFLTRLRRIAPPR
jgi:Family of unknown function (DUF6113)